MSPLRHRTRITTYAALGSLLLMMHHGAHAQQAYPSKPVRLITSAAPGGGIDAVARMVATRFAETVGQTLIVDSRPGANGNLAATLISGAPPDGYTIMLGAIGNLSTNVFFYKQLGYDPMRDLAPITRATSAAQVLVVHPSLPVKSVKELVALARAKPEALAYGSAGTGGTGHLSGELLAALAKIKLLHVPYKGGSLAMIDLVSGQLQLGFSSMTTAIPNINTKRLRALAVTSAQRSRILPDLPPLGEAGVPGYEVNGWYGFVAPAKTPAAVISRLNREITQILGRPDVGEALLKLGLEPWPTTPEEFRAHMKSEHEKWGRVLKQAGITAN